MRSIRRAIAVMIAVLALGGTALSAEGCGAGGHLLAGIAAHHVLNHFVHSAGGRRRVNKLFCLYHGHRLFVDFRNGHYIAAGLNALETLHSCKAGFLHPR